MKAQQTEKESLHSLILFFAEWFPSRFLEGTMKGITSVLLVSKFNMIDRTKWGFYPDPA